MNYTGPFEVEENEVIYAYSKNSLNQEAESYYDITNIVEAKRYLLVDMGDYFILRLNYPSNAGKETREYKWKESGQWKKYEEPGNLLIKPKNKDEILTKDGVIIEDDQGNKIVMKDHYYIVDVPINEVMENLFMRWDTSKPSAPTFVLTNEDIDPTNVSVS